MRQAFGRPCRSAAATLIALTLAGFGPLCHTAHAAPAGVPSVALDTGVGTHGAMRGPWEYDANLTILPAGHMTLYRRLADDGYELLATVSTSGVVAPFFSWQGTLASIGTLRNGQPQSQAYLWIRQNGSATTVQLAAHDRVRRLADGDDREYPHPAGSDLMAVVFVAQDCYRGAHLHDGRREYDVVLRARKQDTLRRSRRQQERGLQSRYYLGPTVLCDYDTVDDEGTARQTRVWLAEIDGEWLPVKVHVKLPGAPDGTMRLILPR